MEEFNIYIESSLKGPSVREAAGMWLIEHMKEDGDIETMGRVLYREQIKENELVLQCLINAFFILNRTGTKSGSVRVFTECTHVLHTINNHWLPIWEKNGWKNAKGKPAANKELWQQLSALMENYAVSVTDEGHSYREIYMKEAIRKELERER